MKTPVLLLLVLCILCVADGNASGAEKQAPQAETPGMELARTISTVTGVAISPLLGMGAVGAYQHYSASPEQRDKLPWFAQPWFFWPALLLVALVALKDVLGAAAPTALKKPFDVAEAMENKVSAMVAAGLFVPLMVNIFPKSAQHGAAALSDAGFAVISMGDVGNWLLVPFVIALFLVVWLAAHAINILILISPFTTVDTILKSFRTSVLGLVCVTAWINPWVGALCSVVVVVIAWLIAGWALRLLILGAVFSWDAFTFRRHRFLPVANGNWMFTARVIGDMPIRTYGKLFADLSGKRTFEYRPWLFMSKQKIELPPGQYAVGRGLFYPELMRLGAGASNTLMILPPRYKGHEADLAKACCTTEVRDVGILKGMKAAWGALRSLFGRNSDAIVAT